MKTATSAFVLATIALMGWLGLAFTGKTVPNELVNFLFTMAGAGGGLYAGSRLAKPK